MAFNQNQMNPNQFRGLHPGKPPVRKTGQPGGKLMRLKCRFRPLQDAYLTNGEITDKDSDVVFICSDGRVRAHKIILACSSMLFIKLFEDQSGAMTTVVVPDVSVEIMRLILCLTYNDNVTMTPSQVKDVGAFLSLFGLNWKQFNCNDPQNPTEPGKPLKSESPSPSQSQLQQQHQHQLQQQQKQKQLQQMQQQYQQQINPRLNPNHGQISINQSLSFGPSGNQSLAARLQAPSSSLHKQRMQEGHGSDGSENSGEFKFQIQGFEQGQGQHMRLVQRNPNRQQPQQQHQVQVRPLKQLLSGGQVQMQGNRKIAFAGTQNPGEGMRGYRRIAPKPLSQQGGDGEMDLYGGVADQLEIQMDTEDSTEEDGQTIDPESGRIMIQEWVQNLGRDNTSLPLKKPAAAGAAAGQARQQNPSDPQPAPNQCLICNNIFEDEVKWHWHETHHVGLGIFKCAFCDELFSTSRKVYQHEMMEHGVTTKEGPSEPPTIPEDFQIVNGRKRKLSPLLDAETAAAAAKRIEDNRLTLVRTLHGSHYRKLPTIPGPSMKRKIALSKLNRANLANNFRSRNPLINIAQVDDEGVNEESRKIRQLHWIYVCNKCEHGVDSLQKAQAHFHQCYPEKDLPFEDTVVKYRQGFYGKIKCPICPRRYTSSAGFKIHCGHMHGDYRRKFSHSNADDSIVCRHCRKRYTDPEQFHCHLSDGECYDAPEFNANEVAAGDRWVGNGNPGEGEESNGPPKLKKEKTSASASASASTPSAAAGSASAATTPTTPAPPPAPTSSSSLSRSTRLTNRILMNSEDGGEGGENKFPVVTCPVCGQAGVEKIVEHLHTAHRELDTLVSRVGNQLLRCQKCRITFSLGDLLAHIHNCEGTKQFQYVSERRAAQAGSRSRVSGPTSEGTSIAIPEGIGCSPVDKMECEDLSSIETLKAAMQCGVCGKSAKKLGIIADCLRSHGINRCVLCFNTYKDKGLYSQHLRQAHGSGGGRLCCPLCPKTFINAGQVAGHMYSSHWLVLLKDKELQDKASSDSKSEKVNDSKTEDENLGDQAILAAVGLTATPSAASTTKAGQGSKSTNDDYASITLGSILSSSDTSYKKDKRGDINLEKSSMDDLIGSKEVEGSGSGTEGKEQDDDEANEGLKIDEGEKN